MIIVPLLLQASRGAVPATPLDLVLGATTVTQVVLIVLAFLSLLSWAIMIGVVAPVVVVVIYKWVPPPGDILMTWHGNSRRSASM